MTHNTKQVYRSIVLLLCFGTLSVVVSSPNTVYGDLTQMELAQPIVPWLDSNYSYLQVRSGEEPNGWNRTDFNPRDFRKGTAGFGTKGGKGTLNSSQYVSTTWQPEKVLLVRKSLQLPENVKPIKITIAVDNRAEVWINDAISVTGESCSGCQTPPKTIVFHVSADQLRPGPNLISVKAETTGGQAYFDMQVIADSGAGGTVLLPYLSGGYRFKAVNSGQEQGFEKRNFDDRDRRFTNGRAAFGSTDSRCPLNRSVKTTWPSGKRDILLRKWISVPRDATNVVLEAAVDNEIQVYVNGHPIGRPERSSGCPSEGNVKPFQIPEDFLIKGGTRASNLIAVRGTNREGSSYLDIKITAGGSTPSGKPIVKWTDPKYSYLQVKPGEEPNGWHGTKFKVERSEFKTGQAGFGTPDGTCPLNQQDVHTPWKSQVLLLRRSFILQAENVKPLTITIAVDDSAEVWVNDESRPKKVESRGCPNKTSKARVVNVNANQLRSGSNLISVRAVNTGGQAYFDMQVTYDTSAEAVVPESSVSVNDQ